MPKLVKLYIRNVLIGFGISAAFVAMILATNMVGMRDLVLNSSSGLLAVFLLWFMNGIVFAGVQFAWAVMSMAERKDRGQGGTPVVQREFAPIPATAHKSGAHKPRRF